MSNYIWWSAPLTKETHSAGLSWLPSHLLLKPQVCVCPFPLSPLQRCFQEHPLPSMPEPFQLLQLLLKLSFLEKIKTISHFPHRNLRSSPSVSVSVGAECACPIPLGNYHLSRLREKKAFPLETLGFLSMGQGKMEKWTLLGGFCMNIEATIPGLSLSSRAFDVCDSLQCEDDK